MSMNAIDLLRRNALLPQMSEDECRNILFDTPIISLNFSQIKTLHFDYPIVSQRVSLAQRLINNGIYADFNQLVSHLESFEIGNRALYQFRQLKQAIISVIIELQQVIEDNKYNLSILGSKNANYKTDLSYFEKTYVYHYFQQILIWYLLEFQAHFITHIPEDKRVQLEDIYFQYLKIAVPDTIHISTTPHNQAVKEANAREIDLDAEIERMPTNAQIFINEVKPYGFLELPKVLDIQENNRALFVTHIMGQPVPYIVAMMNLLGYPKHLKAEYNFTVEKVCKHLGKALNGVSSRQIKGNLNILKPLSKEDPNRYTSQQYIADVERDYQNYKEPTI